MVSHKEEEIFTTNENSKMSGYAATKRCSEIILQKISSKFPEFPFIVIRPGKIKFSLIILLLYKSQNFFYKSQNFSKGTISGDTLEFGGCNNRDFINKVKRIK
jgi:hypothetical protein